MGLIMTILKIQKKGLMAEDTSEDMCWMIKDIPCHIFPTTMPVAGTLIAGGL